MMRTLMIIVMSSVYFAMAMRSTNHGADLDISAFPEVTMPFSVDDHPDVTQWNLKVEKSLEHYETAAASELMRIGLQASIITPDGQARSMVCTQGHQKTGCRNGQMAVYVTDVKQNTKVFCAFVATDGRDAGMCTWDGQQNQTAAGKKPCMCQDRGSHAPIDILQAVIMDQAPSMSRLMAESKAFRAGYAVGQFFIQDVQLEVWKKPGFQGLSGAKVRDDPASNVRAVISVWPGKGSAKGTAQVAVVAKRTLQMPTCDTCTGGGSWFGNLFGMKPKVNCRCYVFCLTTKISGKDLEAYPPTTVVISKTKDKKVTAPFSWETSKWQPVEESLGSHLLLRCSYNAFVGMAKEEQ